MTQNHYDYIIIGAGQKVLTPNPSPKRRGGEAPHKTKPPFFTGACDHHLNSFSQRI